MTNNDGVTGTPVQAHIRLNDSFITNQERKVLHWLAPRMPDWVTPDTLTAFGLFGSLVIFAGYALTFFNPAYLWLATLGFVINWFGDSLDGTLARYRKIERPRYGFFVDHIVDAVSEVLIFIGLGLSPYLSLELALLALVSYLLASVYVYVTTYVNGVFRISYGAMSPTSLRLVAIAANTLVFMFGNPLLPLPAVWLIPESFSMTLFDLAVTGIIIAITILFTVQSFNTARELSRQDIATAPEKTKPPPEKACSCSACEKHRRKNSLTCQHHPIHLY